LSILTPGGAGIRPQHENSSLETGFWNAAVPSMCVVPLQQHTGSRIDPLVRTGDFVREGMVIAESDRRLALPLHAPIPGRVRNIGRVQLFDGTYSAAMSIELDGEFDRLGKHLEPVAWADLSRDELLQRIRAAGVVCGPRSAAPAHLLLGPKRPRGDRVLVLDLAETEPYLTGGVEQAVAASDAVLTGLQIVAAILAAERVHIVIARGYARRLERLRRSAREIGYRVHRVARRYPGITVASLRSFVRRNHVDGNSDDDLFVISPNTAYAIYEAVVFDKPQIDQVIAVGGSAVRRPAHVRVRIGTAIADILAECGGLTAEPARIIAGGPLTGREVANINAPITKTTAAVVAMKREEIHVGGAQEPCIGCGACARACPVELDPQLLHRYILAGQTDDARTAGLPACIECGLCAHVCPSRIPLVDRFREVKRVHPLTGDGVV
jgi:electron transport complex protein RnfC